MKQIKPLIVKSIRFLLNPHLLFCFGIGWIITNGWSYIALGIGTYCRITWLTAIATAYLGFLWLPGTPEKLVTVAIALFLLKKLYPNDTDTLAQLEKLKRKFKKSGK